MRYTEEFKKGMVRLIAVKKMSYKEVSNLVKIREDTLKRWDKKYGQKKAQEEPKEEEKKVKKTKWHRYGSGAGYYE